MTQLSGKVCLITGASGAIGSTIARQLHKEGAHLALGFRRTKPEPLREESGGGSDRVSRFCFDVADWKQVRDAVQEVESKLGQVDVLVNCAGVVGPIGPFETSDVRDWAKTVEINLLGSMYLARAVVPGMMARRQGKIILLSGGGAAYGKPFFTSYSSSKAAVVRFAESLAEELEEANIQVNAVAPGPVKSHMWDQMRAAGASGGPKLLEELKRMDETGGSPPERAAGLVLFLASERSSKLTGRLLSAVWDDWEQLENHIEKIRSSDAGTLRRVPLT
jgi:NAD(P)-dependent dehydrogenase (short-subunit alcohol dehydrogenase family)